MRNLSLLVLALTALLIGTFSQVSNENNNVRQPKSPHGTDFKESCALCHSTKGWVLDKEIYSFNHDLAEMPLVGQHNMLECRQCHQTLVFSEAKKECFLCHTDAHESTVGKECNRCHTPNSWLVNNITQVHQQSRFPLVGVHARVDCYQCHKSETFNRFEVLGTECYNCHQENYIATTQPNHISVGYSTQCIDCHTIYSNEWKGTGFNHDFFPLTQGHSNSICADCHINGNLTKLSQECVSCHEADYNASTNPNHVSAQFSTNCTECHSTSPEWRPTTYNHSIFPLTKGHDINDCVKCHLNGNYTNISSECFTCHQTDYNNTINPAHSVQNFSTNCTECHTTDPGWKPATFNHNMFPLTQGHDINDCKQCHINGNYTNTSNECISCHQTDYNNTSNPAHSVLNFSNNCTECHTTAPGWKPAKYTQHDALSFPIYSGKHINEWSSCTDCHTNTSNYKVFSCIDCHEHNKTEMDDKHSGENGYSYNSAACFDCHPRGTND